MEQPHGFIQNGSEGLICKLRKAIYGLKQASRVWFENLNDTLIRVGYRSAKSDNSLFTKFSNKTTIYVLMYVDNFLITGNSSNEINQLIQHLNQEFSIKDMGDLNYFLGIEVKKSTGHGIELSQKKYIAGILSKTKMEQINSLPTPMVTSPHLSKYIGEAITNAKQ